MGQSACWQVPMLVRCARASGSPKQVEATVLVVSAVRRQPSGGTRSMKSLGSIHGSLNEGCSQLARA